MGISLINHGALISQPAREPSNKVVFPMVVTIITYPTSIPAWKLETHLMTELFPISKPNKVKLAHGTAAS